MAMYFPFSAALPAISNCAATTTVNTVRHCTCWIFLGSTYEFFTSSTVYYDVPHRKARDGKSPGPIELVMNFTSNFASARFWEVRVSQIPFSQRAPAGCLQYFFGNDGIIQVVCVQSCYSKLSSFVWFN